MVAVPPSVGPAPSVPPPAHPPPPPIVIKEENLPSEEELLQMVSPDEKRVDEVRGSGEISISFPAQSWFSQKAHDVPLFLL